MGEDQCAKHRDEGIVEIAIVVYTVAAPVGFSGRRVMVM